MNSNMQVVQVSKQNIVDQMAALLYALKKVPDSVDITDIIFGDLNVDPINLVIVTKGGSN